MKDELENRLKEKDRIVRKFLEQFASNYHLTEKVIDKISTDKTAYEWIKSNSDNSWEEFEYGMFYRDCKYPNQQTKSENKFIEYGAQKDGRQNKTAGTYNDEFSHGCGWEYQ